VDAAALTGNVNGPKVNHATLRHVGREGGGRARSRVDAASPTGNVKGPKVNEPKVKHATLQRRA